MRITAEAAPAACWQKFSCRGSPEDAVLTTSPTSGALSLLLGGALISLSAVFVKLVSVSPTVSAFYRVGIGAAALCLVLLIRKTRPDLADGRWRILLLAGVLFAADLWCWHRSIVAVGPGLATLLGNFQALLMPIGGWLVYRERLSVAQAVAIPVALGGLSLILGSDWQDMPDDYLAGVFYGFATAVVYTLYLLTLRHMRSAGGLTGAAWDLACISLLSGLFLGLLAVAEGESLRITVSEDWLWLGVYGVVAHALGWVFIAGSLPLLTAATGGLILLSQPLLSFCWDVLLFNRSFTLQEGLGALTCMAAIALGSMARSSAKSA